MPQTDDNLSSPSSHVHFFFFLCISSAHPHINENFPHLGSARSFWIYMIQYFTFWNFKGYSGTLISVKEVYKKKAVSFY